MYKIKTTYCYLIKKNFKKAYYYAHTSYFLHKNDRENNFNVSYHQHGKN